MTLSNLKGAHVGFIKGFTEDLQEDFRRRLRELGFCEGASIRLVRSTPFGGPQIFCVSDAIYSIESELSGKILIEVPES